jgi:dTDP-D-glucose 4,6-dehydratase
VLFNNSTHSRKCLPNKVVLSRVDERRPAGSLPLHHHLGAGSGAAGAGSGVGPAYGAGPGPGPGPGDACHPLALDSAGEPGAASKAAAEMLVNSYSHSFKMPIIITRGNNVYGPNQYPEKVIPKFIKQLKNNEKLTIQGDGSCVRAFLHSNDTAAAFIKILEMGKIGEIYNIGCDANMEYSILDIAKILIKKIKGEDAEFETWIEYIEDRPFNDKRYYISNNKLKELGWNIYINLEKGIDELLR